ncbi:MAG TPA: zinc-ribbon and DUF3426 domain-containing protein [Steroidobacteraceae bacterium]|nr:zinc-ribbon and DUF3426 domain-containing protein [Steroidobacteraceae bacterium]
MFTVCPKCTLTLVVTTVDLRAGQGYVRCGRCANVFNALIALREGDPNGGTGDTASRRLQETAPQPPVNPAVGAGVADREPEPEPEQQEPEAVAQPEPEPAPQPEEEIETPHEEEIVLSGEPSEPESESESESEPEADYGFEDPSLEFDAAATDVSEIFISPSEAEHDTGSGNYEAVVLGDEAATEAASEPAHEIELEAVPHDISHTDTVAAAEWSLLDDEPHADAESVIEESPFAQSTDDTMAAASNQPDPPWVQEMFAEAEADAERVRTAEHELFQPGFDQVDEEGAEAAVEEAIEDPTEDPTIVRVARASTGSEAPSDTALEPLLHEPAIRRPRWQYVSGVAALVALLVIQVLHFNRQNLVLNNTFGPAISTVYGWFGTTLTPRWDLTAYSVKQLGAEAEGGEGTQLRVRLSLQNDSQRVQPLPLLRLTLQDRYGNAVATRDLEPMEYLPARAKDQRLLEPDQRIDAELHVIDPGRAAIGFEIDACLRGDGGAIGCAHDARRRTAG